MTNDAIREHCLSLPDVTETVQWGDHLLFKVGGKMFAIIELDGHSCALRCTPDSYAELVEMEDIVPSSHNMWKYQWVTIETLTAVPDRQFRDLLSTSYQLVRAGLSKKVLAALEGGPRPKTPKKRGKPKAAPKSGAPEPGRGRPCCKMCGLTNHGRHAA